MIMKTLKRLVFALGMVVLLSMAYRSTALADPTIDNDTTTTSSDSGRIDDANRSDADADLYHYMNSLMVQYELNEVQYDRLQDVFNSAVYYIANTDMTIAQLQSYVASVKSDMVKVASTDVTTITSEYLAVADNWSTPTVSYGQAVSIVLPIINVGTETLNDLVIEPEVSNDVKVWPFVPDSTGYVQTEPYIPGYVNDQYAFDNRREFTYHFKVRDDVMTGYYELKFKISFRRAGVRAEEATELSVFVHTFGKPESGFIGGNGNEANTPKSRIIVTGYETNPGQVYSGDTFNLTLHVQNTSQTTAVSNILFELVAASETVGGGASGSGNNSVSTAETVSPLLPTSGANSLYVARIAPGETTDLNIEMSAKAGLSQKSYVLGLNMTYDSGTQFDLTEKTNISIPIYQEATFDTSTIELAPASINVGSQTNLMFSIYNTGKTNLYNTQVTFEADSIENNMAFVGNLASGATGNVDVMLTGIAPTMDDGTIKIIISYEDEAGNVTKEEKTATLFVNEIMMDDLDMSGDGSGRRGMEEEEENSGMSPLVRGLIIAAGVLVLGALIAIPVVLSKRKKEKALHEEDLKDLEDIKDLEEEKAEEEKTADNKTDSVTESDKD